MKMTPRTLVPNLPKKRLRMKSRKSAKKPNAPVIRPSFCKSLKPLLAHLDRSLS